MFDPRGLLEGEAALVHVDADDSDPADVGLLQATALDPTGDIISAIDLLAWLNGSPAEDRKMLELRAASAAPLN